MARWPGSRSSPARSQVTGCGLNQRACPVCRVVVEVISVDIHVETPVNLTSKQKKLLEEFAAGAGKAEP